jgi:hypothetical protein
LLFRGVLDVARITLTRRVGATAGPEPAESAQLPLEARHKRRLDVLTRDTSADSTS